MVEAKTPTRLRLGRLLPRLVEDWVAAQQRRQSAIEATRRTLDKSVREFLATVDKRLTNHRWYREGWSIFGVLGRTRLEDAHSDTIAWLFDPTQAHGLGCEFSEKFLRRSCRSPLPSRQGIVVQPRKRIATGVVDIEVAGHDWWLAVENKVGGDEREGQTADYSAHYEKLGRIRRNVFLVYLTPNRRKPKSPASKFDRMSYRDLREVLETLRPRTEAGRMVVEHFVSHIRRDLEWPECR